MRVSVVSPVLNEVDFIGYSILACLDEMHEFVYSLDAKSDDGTRELLHHIKDKYAHEKLTILEIPTFHPHDMKAYNNAFDVCIEKATGDACMFLHADQIITNPKTLLEMKEGPMAWTTSLTSYAGDFQTQITKGRAKTWKNIHAKQLGLIYRGGYGSQNEDFYHSDITGNVYSHFGEDLLLYPYEVAKSGIEINHYCECKTYRRRLEKMKLCIETQNPGITTDKLLVISTNHPRVTLESSSKLFGEFEFTKTDKPIPDVFEKYKEEFDSFKKEVALV